MGQKTSTRIGNILSYTFLVLSLVFFLFPIFWMILTSLKQTKDTFAIPPVWIFKPSFENYQSTFVDGSFFKSMITSFEVTITAVVIATMISALAAYGTSRFHFRGKSALLLSLLVFYTIPGIAYAIPLYIIYGRLKIQDTPLGLIIIFIALTIPFATWVLHGYFISIPRDLEECAMVDGCTRLGALIRIVLPLSAPGIAATSILTFIATWNNFLYPAILAGSKTKTLPVAMSAFITDLRIEWGQAAAVASSVIIPVMILILLAQKYIVLGLVSGAVKE
jgi:multiple sugar transport system permease protein